MRIICPRCSTTYEVEDKAIPHQGCDVRCMRCYLVWSCHPNTLHDQAQGFSVSAQISPHAPSPKSPEKIKNESQSFVAAPSLNTPAPAQDFEPQAFIQQQRERRAQKSRVSKQSHSLLLKLSQKIKKLASHAPVILNSLKAMPFYPNKFWSWRNQQMWISGAACFFVVSTLWAVAPKKNASEILRQGLSQVDLSESFDLKNLRYKELKMDDMNGIEIQGKVKALKPGTNKTTVIVNLLSSKGLVLGTNSTDLNFTENTVEMDFNFAFKNPPLGVSGIEVQLPE